MLFNFKKEHNVFQGGEYNKMLEKIVTRKRGNLSLEQVVEVFLKSNFLLSSRLIKALQLLLGGCVACLLFRVLSAGLFGCEIFEK